MKLLTAVKFIILAHASCYAPSVLCTKGGMGDNTAATATMEDGNNDERKLASSSSTDYEYTRNYLTITEPENFVTVFPNGAPNIGPAGLTSLVGSSTIQKGGVYDPADIDLVNKLNGVESEDLTPEVIDFFGGSEGDALEAIGGFKFAGDRQPKQPVPPGDSAFFYHGECVVNSAINSPSPFQDQRQLGSGGIDALDAFLASFTVTSHTCNLNICLGGGGFNCIAFYSGTSFVFDLGEQISRSNPKQPTPPPPPIPPPPPTVPDVEILVTPETGGNTFIITATGDNLLGRGRDLSVEMPEPFNGEIKLPPPFPSTIIGGTGSFEGIEGTVDIATICGTTGPILSKVDGAVVRRLESGPFDQTRLGLIVQTISIKSNMPLPVAP